MKRFLFLALALALGVLLIPAAVYARFGTPPQAPPEETTTEASDPDVLRVFFPEENAARDLKLRDYIAGAVAGEMPALYEEEALKAQAAAAVTLARYLLKRGPQAALDGAVIQADHRKNQAYLSEETLRERWGDDFETYYARILSAVDEALPYTLTYEGEPILAVFHAVSAGFTRPASEVWGGDYPYLKSVPSEGDRLSPDYLQTVSFSPGDFFSALGLDVPDDPADAVTDAEYSDEGYLLSVRIAGRSFSGTDLRERLSLRSAAARIAFEDGVFRIETRGYGHGVGMSQYGADFLARQGLTWREILAHYYPGAALVKEDGA